MPRWNDGLVNAFPIPDETPSKLRSKKGDNIKDVAKQDAEIELDLPIPDNPDPFPYFSLPAELRNRIYNLVLFTKPPYRIATGKRKGSRLAVLLASKQFHQESSYALYTTHKFLIFPIQEFTALPTIQELPLHYRRLVSNLVMRVGSSWTNPPKSWRVSKAMKRCLMHLRNVQTISVFVEFDPSHPAFRKFRISESFYTDFIGELLGDVLDTMPQVQYVQLDGNPGVDVHGPLVTRLREEAAEQDKQIRWGREARWAHSVQLSPSPASGSSPSTIQANTVSTVRDIIWPTMVNVNAAMLHNKMMERVRNV